MADKKISQLTAATTPLAGTEVLPIVQGGSTVKVAVSDLTAGRNVSAADLTTTGNTILGNAAADTLNVGNGGLIKDASGNIGIGATPSAWSGWAPAIEGAGGTTFVRAGNSAHSGTNWYYSGGNFIYKINGYATWIRELNGSYEWYTAASGTAGNNITFNLGMKLDINRDLTLSAGNLIVGTAGKGIDFSANTNSAGMTSELLTRYETGTWTPSVGGDATYSARSGVYTRIGNVVTVSLDMTINVLGTGNTNAISGLPFAVGTTGAASTIYYSDLALNSLYITAVGSGSSLVISGQSTAQTSMVFGPGIFGNGARIQMTAIYFV